MLSTLLLCTAFNKVQIQLMFTFVKYPLKSSTLELFENANVLEGELKYWRDVSKNNGIKTAVLSSSSKTRQELMGMI